MATSPAQLRAIAIKLVGLLIALVFTACGEGEPAYSDGDESSDIEPQLGADTTADAAQQGDTDRIPDARPDGTADSASDSDDDTASDLSLDPGDSNPFDTSDFGDDADRRDADDAVETSDELDGLDQTTADAITWDSTLDSGDISADPAPDVDREPIDREANIQALFDPDPDGGRWTLDPIIVSENTLSGLVGGPLALSGHRLGWTNQHALEGGQVLIADDTGLGVQLLTDTTDDYWAALTGQMYVGDRFVSWAGNDGEASIFLVDLGPDGQHQSGDDLFGGTPLALARFERQRPVAFDWDMSTSELAFVDRDRLAIEVRQHQVTVEPPRSPRLTVTQQHTLCTDCTEIQYSVDYGTDVGIDRGCLAFSDSERRVRLVCRNNDVWGDGDDTDVEISNLEGECSPDFSKVNFRWYGRGIDISHTDAGPLVAWIGLTYDVYPQEIELCLWSAEAGPARRIQLLSTRSPRTLSLDEDLLVFLESTTGSYEADILEVFGFRVPGDFGDEDVALQPPVPLSIMPGRIDRLHADQGRVAIARRRNGPDYIEIYPTPDQPLTQPLQDRVAPDFDGPRIVWIDYRHHHCGEVYLYDEDFGVERRLTQTDCSDATPWLTPICPRVSGRQVIWNQFERYPSGNARRCEGELYGIEVPADSFSPLPEVIHITGALGVLPQDYRRVGRAQISNGRVVFEVYDATWAPRVYLYEWGADLPTADRPLVEDWSAQPDISGDRVVYVAWITETPWAGEVYSCSLDDDCAVPIAITQASSPCNGYWYNDQFYCFPIRRHRPIVDGERVVWLDDHEQIESQLEYESEAIFHLYAYDFTDPIENGVQVSTTAWRSPWYRGAHTLIAGESGGLYQRYWDTAEPSLGWDDDVQFVVISSFQRVESEGFAPHLQPQDVLRIDLDGPRAFEEQLVPHEGTWVGGPVTDASGRVLWQDLADGTFFRIVDSEGNVVGGSE